MRTAFIRTKQKLERPVGIEPTLKRWQRIGLPISDGRENGAGCENRIRLTGLEDQSLANRPSPP